MTASLRRRRHAERFAQLLDEADGRRRHHVRTRLDGELADLVTVRQQLDRITPAATLDSEFRTGLRAMLMATAEREGIGATAAPTPAASTPADRRGPGRRGLLARVPRARTAVIAGVTVGAITFAGMSTASENAVPGDALYGVKRSTERAQLALASSDIGRGELYLDFARTRLDEAQSMDGALGRVLADMDRETSHGVRLLAGAAASRHDLSALTAVDRFVDAQVVGLTELAAAVGGDDLARVRSSLALLEDVTQRSEGLRQALAECEPPTAGEVDSLGPLPSDCVTLPAPRALPPLTPPAGSPAQDEPEDAAGRTDRTPSGTQPDPGEDRADDGPSGADPAGPDDPADSTGDDRHDDDGEPGDEPEDDGLLGGLGRLIGNLLGD